MITINPVGAKKVLFTPIIGNNQIIDADPKIFEIDGTSITTNTFSEIGKFSFDISDIGKKNVVAIDFDLSWKSQVIGISNGSTIWEIGMGLNPSAWVQMTDQVQATVAEEDNHRSGRGVFDEAKELPFSIRMMGKINTLGDELKVKFLSSIMINVFLDVI